MLNQLARVESDRTETSRRRILVVDDEQDTASVIAEVLARRGFATHAMTSATECLEHLDHASADVVITDIMMPGMSGIELCEHLQHCRPEMLSIVLTGRSCVASATSALRAGAYDYLPKPIEASALEVALMRALVHLEVKRELRELRAAAKVHSPEVIIGESGPMRAMRGLIRRVAETDATVLIRGESGTGKERVARSLHLQSSRANAPFVAVNCAAIPGPLLESELFGHVGGAYTDASESRPGLFVQAGAGTILLDEIGDMPRGMQVKLLRVLQSRKVRPVGSDVEFPMSARVLASTNCDLERAVFDKRFREDLYYRLDVVSLDVPPLRSRGSDVLLLAQHFIRTIALRTGKPVVGFTPAVARVLGTHDWPGNVRELENCIERACALCRLDQITLDDLPSALCRPPAAFVLPGAELGDLVTLAEMGRRYARQVMAASAGNKAKAARVLGIDRRSLYRRLGDE